MRNADLSAWLMAAALGPVAVLSTTCGRGSPDVTSYAHFRLTCPEDGADYLSIRRLKLITKGQINPRTDYYVQVIYKDGNRSATDGQPYLQEARIRWKLGSGRLTIGQFKPPFGMERFTSDWKIDSIDRSHATNSLIPDGKMNRGRGFVRDRGVQWETKFAHDRLWWALGLFEGHGGNVDPRGFAPLVTTRLVWTAENKKSLRLKLGAALSNRVAKDLNFASALPGTAPLGYKHFSGRDTRWSLETSLDWRGTRFRGECFHARFVPHVTNQPEVTATGFYLVASRAIAGRLEGVAKYEGFDPNDRVLDKHDLRETTVGLNYYLRDRRDRVQVNYVFKRERADAVPNDALIVQLQKFF